MSSSSEPSSAAWLATSTWVKLPACCRACSRLFIDIGLERAAFLHVADLLPNLNARHNRESGAEEAVAAAPPIERQVFEGQSILVQVLKDPHR